MDDTIHKKGFTYLYIPACISDAVEVRTFPPGKTEAHFRNLLKSSFSTRMLTTRQKKEYEGTLTKSAEESIAAKQRNDQVSKTEETHSEKKTNLSTDKKTVDISTDEKTVNLSTDEKTDNLLKSDDNGSSSSSAALSSQNVGALISSASELMSDGSYQILPLTLPSKSNGHIGLNCYIDALGRVKELDKNSRASRLTTDDIHGDCFLCKTFDDDESDFGRLDIGLEEYQCLLANPPDKTGRWDQQMAFEQLTEKCGMDSGKAKQLGGGGGGMAETKKQVCENCGKDEEELRNSQGPGSVGLRKCGRCGKVKYCSRECQKADWRFHRRICA